jgi:hypothetical protein
MKSTIGGYLSIPTEQWSKLNDDDKAFVQKYNSKVKHQESVNTIKVPSGVTIKSKARRNKTVNETNDNDHKDTKDIDTTPPSSKKQKKSPKKIQFSVNHSDEEEE